MSGITEVSPIFEKQYKLVDEIVELRQFKADRSSLVKTTQYYMDLVSQLELNVSQLKAELMAKDYEIQLLSKKIVTLTEEKNQALSISQINTPNKKIPELNENSPNHHNSINTNADECKNLKIQLQKEKKFNEMFENQLIELGTNILLSEDSNFQSQYDKKIKVMQTEISNLYEENKMLRLKFSCEHLDSSTINKTLNSSDLKTSIIDLESVESVSATNSSPRFETSLPIINHNNKFNPSFPVEESFESPKKYINPEPPQTRCNPEYPKKALVSGRQVKYVKCTLNEIVNSPSKTRQVADFCPSSMRKARAPTF